MRIYWILLILVPQFALASELKIISYNVWHALQHDVPVRTLEDDEHREQRLAWQIKQLKELQADIILLQEVEPLETQSRWYAQQLGMDYVIQADTCPFSLNHLKRQSGLVILAKPQLRLKKIKGERLSGEEECKELNILASDSSRMALLAEVELQKKGRYLVVNTQLHEKIGLSRNLRDDVFALAKKYAVKRRRFKKVLAQIHEADKRRETEVLKLYETIRWLKFAYRGVILGGNFNIDPTNQALTPLRQLGLYDSFYLSGYEKDLDKTWSPLMNALNFSLLSKNFRHFKFKKRLKNAAFETALKKAYFDEYGRAKRIDYVFVTANLIRGLTDSGVTLAAENREGIIGSDHFGVFASVEL